MDLEFTVRRYETIEKAGEPKKVKVVLDHPDGHRLTLHGDESIKKGYPLEDNIPIKIESRKTLEDF